MDFEFKKEEKVLTANVGDIIISDEMNYLIVDLLEKQYGGYKNSGYSAINLNTSCKVYHNFNTINELLSDFEDKGIERIIKASELKLVEV